MRKIISSIDIGSNEIKIVVCEFFDGNLNVLCAHSEETKGLKNGQVVKEEVFVSCVSKMLSDVSEKLGFKVKKLVANFPTSSNNFIVSESTNTITSENKTITSNDILRIMQSSVYNKVNINEELIGVIPIYFRVDGEEYDDPFGKKGENLTAKTVLITAPKEEVYHWVTILEKCGIDVVDITTSGLVDYYNFKNDNLNDRTGIIVNIGNETTTISVFSKGMYINNEVLIMGGYFIDKDISFIYNFKRDDARYLKEKLALANIRRASPKETMRLANKDGEEIVVNQYELTEIVASRVDEILKLVKKSINHLTKKEISYIIITGGLTELKDFPIALTSVFGESAKIGNINTIGIRSNKYSVALGTIKYFNEKLRLRHKDYSTVSNAEAEAMCNVDKGTLIAGDSILGKVFGYFFDN